MFGPLPDDDGPRRRAHIAPADAPPELAELAARLPRTVHLGTSSWSFPGWRGLVYAANAAAGRLAAQGLSAYAQHPLLRAVGVDRTFYAPVQAADFARWADAVPADFRFLVKAWSEVTSPTRRYPQPGPSPHYLDAATARERVLAPAAEGLGDKLGVVLFQFSPQGQQIVRAPQRFADDLHRFCAALPANVPRAVELRDHELLVPEVAAALAATGTQLAYAVHPALPPLPQQQRLVGAAGPLVLRWMLRPDRRYEEAKEQYEPFDRLAEPDPTSRRDVVDLIAGAVAAGREVFAIANNKAEGCAPLTLQALAQALVAAGVVAG